MPPPAARAHTPCPDPPRSTVCTRSLAPWAAGLLGLVALASSGISAAQPVESQTNLAEEAETPTADPALGRLQIRSPHYGATLLIDRQPRARLPLKTPLALAPGFHLVEVTVPRKPRWSRVVFVEANQTLSVEVLLAVAPASGTVNPGAVDPGTAQSAGSAGTVSKAGNLAGATAPFGPGRAETPIGLSGDAGLSGARPPTRIRLRARSGVAAATAGDDVDVDAVQGFEVAVADLAPNLSGQLSGRAIADVFTRGRELRRVVQPTRSAVVRLDDARLRWQPGRWRADAGRVPFMGPGLSAAAVDGLSVETPPGPGQIRAQARAGRGVTPFGPRPHQPLLLGLALSRAAETAVPNGSGPPDLRVREGRAAPPDESSPIGLAGGADALWYADALHLDGVLNLRTKSWGLRAASGWVDRALAEAHLGLRGGGARFDGGLALSLRRPVGGPFRLVNAFADPALAIRPDHVGIAADLGGDFPFKFGTLRAPRWGLGAETRRARGVPEAANPHQAQVIAQVDQRLGAFDLGLDLAWLGADAGEAESGAALLERRRGALRGRWRLGLLRLDLLLGTSHLDLRDADGTPTARWLPEGGFRVRADLVPGLAIEAASGVRGVHPLLYPGAERLWDGQLFLVIE